MRLSRVAFGQIPFEVRPVTEQSPPYDAKKFLVIFSNGPNALDAQSVLKPVKPGEKKPPPWLTSCSHVDSYYGTSTLGEHQGQCQVALTVASEIGLEKLKDYLAALFEPIQPPLQGTL